MFDTTVGGKWFLRACLGTVFACSYMSMSCGPASQSSSSERRPPGSETTKPATFPISGEVAVLIAKARASADLDLTFVDYKVIENTDSWTVNFELKPEYKARTGGEATMEVAKATGEITALYFGK